MARIPIAARTLIDQVKELQPDASVTYDERCGFGIYRTIWFDQTTSAWLQPVMEVIAPSDKRIAALVASDDHRTPFGVRFQPDARADTSEPYELTAVNSVLSVSELTLTSDSTEVEVDDTPVEQEVDPDEVIVKRRK